jgi:hypothetical protein
MLLCSICSDLKIQTDPMQHRPGMLADIDALLGVTKMNVLLNPESWPVRSSRSRAHINRLYDKPNHFYSGFIVVVSEPWSTNSSSKEHLPKKTRRRGGGESSRIINLLTSYFH